MSTFNHRITIFCDLTSLCCQNTAIKCNFFGFPRKTLRFLLVKMIENTLEEDLPPEFQGGVLRIANSDPKMSNYSTPMMQSPIAEKPPGCVSGTFLAGVPKKISESIWKGGTKDKRLQPALHLNEDASNYFTFREGVIDKAVENCMEILEIPTQILGSYLLTLINYWDTDKERLILLTTHSVFIVKYDFIALKLLETKKIPLENVSSLVLGDLVYPQRSLIPRLNGLADGISNVLEQCLFTKWSKTNNKPLDSFYQPRNRNMKGCRVVFDQKQVNFASKWNPFNEDCPFSTFTYHPLYFHKECLDHQKSVYNLDSFVEKLVIALDDLKVTPEGESLVKQEEILLENYVGVGSLIHNRNALGFFKVRGKFSF